VQAPLATAPNPMLGNLLATLSGVFWALTIVGLRWIGRAEPGRIGAAVVTGNALAFLACLPMAAPFLHVGLRDGAIVGFLGVFQIGVAYVFLTRGVREVSALEASVLLLIEPALNPIWAWWIQHETPGRWSLLGGVLIVGTTVLRTWWGLPRGARARSGSAV
jgi:DME family drug/metabolite transporter